MWKVKPDKYDDFDPVLEVWESMGGDLWFITEEPSNGRAFGYARLAAMPQFAEWGTINYAKLQDSKQIWEVEEEKWSNINTYEDGLLEDV